ncbi:MAG: hypothetical protein WBH25_01165 [Coprothermobacter proteolyticus]
MASATLIAMVFIVAVTRLLVTSIIMACRMLLISGKIVPEVVDEIYLFVITKSGNFRVIHLLKRLLVS